MSQSGRRRDVALRLLNELRHLAPKLAATTMEDCCLGIKKNYLKENKIVWSRRRARDSDGIAPNNNDVKWSY